MKYILLSILSFYSIINSFGQTSMNYLDSGIVRSMKGDAHGAVSYYNIAKTPGRAPADVIINKSCK